MKNIHPKAQALRDKGAELMQARLSVPLSFLQYAEGLAKLCDEAINTVELLEHSIALHGLLQRAVKVSGEMTPEKRAKARRILASLKEPPTSPSRRILDKLEEPDTIKSGYFDLPSLKEPPTRG